MPLHCSEATTFSLTSQPARRPTPVDNRSVSREGRVENRTPSFSRPVSGLNTTTPTERVHKSSDPSIWLSKDSSQSQRKSPTWLEDSMNKAIDGPIVSRSLQRSQVELARSLTFVNLRSNLLEQSLNVITEFDKSQVGRLGCTLEGSLVEEDSLDQLVTSPEPIDTAAAELEDIEGFVIPELPSGRVMIIEVHSTWGDKHYLGLTGIELFSDKGDPVEVKKITADPSDINVLSGYSNDPRIVGNLLNGVNRTRDDLNMWLTPFTPGHRHTITIEFEESSTLALLRFWNYNKSRIHSYRGVRDVTVTLDDVTVFKGEVARACGGLAGGTEAYGDTILFTEEEGILELVAGFDMTYQGELEDMDEEGEIFLPPTSPDTRPLTTYGHNTARHFQPATQTLEEEYLLSARAQLMDEIQGRVLALTLMDTWGDPDYIGLTGIEIYGGDGEMVDISGATVTGPSLNELEECSGDYRTPDKVVSGCNLTVEDNHMWLAPYTPGTEHVVRIALESTTSIAAIKVFNYNKSTEDSYRGARRISLSLDGTPLCQGHSIHLRRAPGSTVYDFGQLIDLSESWGEDVLASTNTTPLPTGFVLQIQIYTSWGDPFYVGLNELTIFDETGAEIPLEPSQLSADPESVNVLTGDVDEGAGDDVRTPDKLVNHIVDDNTAHNSWLAPFLPPCTKIYIVFDVPVVVAGVRLHNYNKTPARGVRQFGVLMDDLLIYHGHLPLWTPSTSYQDFLFSEPSEPLSVDVVKAGLPQNDFSFDLSARPITSLVRPK